MVPVQITDSHQCERRAASSLRGLIYLLPFIREGVEVDNRDITLGSRIIIPRDKFMAWIEEQAARKTEIF